MTRRRPCVRCGRNRAERFFVSARGRVCADCRRRRVRATGRDQRLRDTYGITLTEFKQLLESQGGGCAICGGRRRVNLDLDHCHLTGVVRGVLCRRCNRRLLPAATDSVEVLRRAIDYLLSPPAVAVLGERRVPERDGSDS